MSLKLRSLSCLAALSVLLLTGVPADAGVMGVELFVDGALVGSNLVEEHDGVVSLDFAAADDSFQLDGIALLDADPFLDFSFFVLNLADAQEFTVVFSLPYSLGPYDTLSNEFSSTVSDLDQNGTASVVPSGTFMSTPILDGAAVAAAGLGSGCAAVGAPGFVDLTCDSSASTSVNVVTLADGNFGASVAFTLSGGDSISGRGRVELTNTQIPEPVSVLLLGLGVGAAVGRRRFYA